MTGERTAGESARVKSKVAAAVDAQQAEAVRRMSPAERVELALRLGDAAIESFCATHGVDRRTAIRSFERRRQATRQPSACIERLIG